MSCTVADRGRPKACDHGMFPQYFFVGNQVEITDVLPRIQRKPRWLALEQ
jgi:hypothetical protein